MSIFSFRQRTTLVYEQDDSVINHPDRVKKERRATWLELFYDLAYVAVIAQLTYLVGSHHSPLELYVFVLLFMMIFTSWWITTVNRNVNEKEDTLTIFAVQVQMFFALVMSAFLPSVFDGGTAGFVAGFVGTRLVAMFLINNYYKNNPERVPPTKNVYHGYLISTGAWAATIFLAPPLQFLWWTILLVYDFLIPFTQGKGNRVTVLNPTHFQERLGLFALLVMGESVLVVAIAGGVSGLIGGIEGGIIGAAGLIILSALWWVYFPYIEKRAYGQRPNSLIKFLYMHILLFMAVIIFAVGIKEFIGGVTKQAELSVNLYILVSLILAILSFNGIKYAMGHLHRKYLILSGSVTSFLILIVIGFEMLDISALWTLAALALSFAAYAIFEHRLDVRDV